MTNTYLGVDPIERTPDMDVAELHVMANIDTLGVSGLAINTKVNGNPDNAALSTLASSTHPGDVDLRDHLVVFDAGILIRARSWPRNKRRNLDVT